MIAFRCRKHRQPLQRLWQVTLDREGRPSGRTLEGVPRDGALTSGGWRREERSLTAGLYCQTCLHDGDTSPIPDYDEQDLADAGLLDTPHIGLSAADFILESTWAKIEQEFGHLVVATRDRAEGLPSFDGSMRTDPRLHASIRESLFDRVLGGGNLWTHQATAIDAALAGHDTMVETATASGKSLTYWVPVLNEVMRDPNATALYLAPLNALVEDQLQAVERFGMDPPIRHTKPGTFDHAIRRLRLGPRTVLVARYDGTIQDQDVRRRIRGGRPQVLVTNPDMLHRSMLPHHAGAWSHMFSNLSYIVLDELHVYRGMFGANFANVLRRVLRLARHHGRKPQILACSASIGNPRELFTAVTGRTQPVIIPAAASGAPVHRQRRVVLDLRRGEDAMSTVAKDLVVASVGKERARTIAFMRSIPEVDQVHRYVTGELARRMKGIGRQTVREYKREIPPDEKAQVTADLRSGATLGVISTTALQLGIDIGELSVCVVCKFPGSKAAFFQQGGRVGRRGESLVLFIADESPLDQHFARRPEELLDAMSEVVYLNPDHRETVLQHLWCAAEELPFDAKRDAEFWGPDVALLYQELMERGRSAGREVFVLGRPGERAREVDIRSLGFEAIVRDEGGREVAKPDVLRAMRRFHKYARFQIQERAYEVTRLSINWNEQTAEATARALDRLDYSTASILRTECTIREATVTLVGNDGAQLERGDVRFIVQVDGYYKIPTNVSDTPQYQPLGKAAPPRHELDTSALWISGPAGWLDDIAVADRLPSVKSATESLRISAALLSCTDPDDIVVHTEPETADAAFRLFLADNAPGGNGLTEQLFGQPGLLLEGALRILTDCPHCKDRPESRGCPCCVTTTWGDEQDVCRSGGIAMLRRLRESLS
jgi:DEAD/DEAH box helicase domain-containing protein